MHTQVVSFFMFFQGLSNNNKNAPFRCHHSKSNDSDWSSLWASFEVSFCPVSRTKTLLQRYCNNLIEDLGCEKPASLRDSRSKLADVPTSRSIGRDAGDAGQSVSVFYGDHHT